MQDGDRYTVDTEPRKIVGVTSALLDSWTMKDGKLKLTLTIVQDVEEVALNLTRFKRSMPLTVSISGEIQLSLGAALRSSVTLWFLTACIRTASTGTVAEYDHIRL